MGGYRGSLDIVTRLREEPLPSLNRIVQDRADAASEIERLRAEVDNHSRRADRAEGRVADLEEALAAGPQF